jgi:hypothetical protein
LSKNKDCKKIYAEALKYSKPLRFLAAINIAGVVAAPALWRAGQLFWQWPRNACHTNVLLSSLR